LHCESLNLRVYTRLCFLFFLWGTRCLNPRSRVGDPSGESDDSGGAIAGAVLLTYMILRIKLPHSMLYLASFSQI